MHFTIAPASGTIASASNNLVTDRLQLVDPRTDMEISPVKYDGQQRHRGYLGGGGERERDEEVEAEPLGHAHQPVEDQRAPHVHHHHFKHHHAECGASEEGGH